MPRAGQSATARRTAQSAAVGDLLDRYGRSYAEEAGIRLADKPAPLYQLLVLATLLSARITAGVAVAAARELFAAGYRTPRAMARASWQDRVDALGRGHYRRYDERTATMLGDGADLLLRRWRGDLRRLRAEAGGDAGRVAAALTAFPGHWPGRRRHLPAGGPGRLAGGGAPFRPAGAGGGTPGGPAGRRWCAGQPGGPGRPPTAGRRTRPGQPLTAAARCPGESHAPGHPRRILPAPPAGRQPP
jgi:hypothetical protein